MLPLLLQRFPRLDVHFVPLSTGPTPTREVPLADAGAGRLFVKDEGAISPVYGGNKVRKLELVLGDAKRAGATELLTMGAVGSHHVLATALHGRDHGLRTWAVLLPQPISDHAEHTARHNAASLAGWVTANDAIDLPMAFARLFARARLQGPVMRIPMGGSSIHGALAWVSAGLEIGQDVESGAMPAPDRVYVPLGTCGTIAGLLVGLRLAGLRSEVVGVRVVPRTVGSRAKAMLLAGQIQRRLGTDAPLDGLRVVGGFYGAGYGRADARVMSAVDEGRRMGFSTERTYTGKALAACLAELRERRSGISLWIDTVSSVPLAPSTNPLPDELQRKFIP